MSEHPISRFPIPELADMPDDIREMMEAVQEKSRFIPNAFFAMSNRLANLTSMRPNDEFYAMARSRATAITGSR
jgi:hypothetical protein